MSSGNAIDFPWLRRIELTFSGLRGGNGKKLVSTGKQGSLRITARIQKSIIGVASPAQIMIYNLDKDTRDSFVRSKTTLLIEAGWDHGPLTKLTKCYEGELLSAESHRHGPDIVTVINSIPGCKALSEANIRKTWPAGEKVRKIVEELAKMLPNVTVDTTRMIGIDQVVGDGGWSYSGLIKDTLEALGKEFSFSSSVIDQVFQAVGDKVVLEKVTTIEDPYLIDVNPMLATPLQVVSGISWKCTFNPAVMPGEWVKINSTLSKHNGTYRVNIVNHDLDCFSKHSFITTGGARTIEGGKK